MKKTALVIGGIFALLLAAIVIIPLVVDVNQYNPKIVKVANEKLNGSLELGRLSLSLWGKIHVGVDGLVVRDTQKRAVVAVKDASFDMPYSSIFSGAPLVTLRMVKPEILVIKDKAGKLNMMNLMKQSAQDPSKPEAAGGGEPSQKVELPGMVVNAHIGLSIEDARLVYRDEALALSNTIDQLNIRVKDFSLTRKTDIEVWADLKTTMGTDLKMEGPLKLIADLSPEVSGGEFKSAAVNANLTADDLMIQKGDLFMKKKGVPANFSFKGVLGQENMKLDQAAVRFHNAEIVVTGTYHQVNGADIHFEAKPIEVKPWSELVPMLKEYELEGKLGLKGEVRGNPNALQYAATLTAQNFAMKGPNLKAKPVINAEIMVATDRIEKIYAELKGPGNELLLTGKMLSFSKPQLSFTLSSKGMDLDQWIEFPKTETKPAKKEEKKSSTAGGKGDAPAGESDYDAMLAPLRKNEIMKAMTVDGTVSIAFLKAMNVRIDDIGAKIQMKNLVAALTGLKMKMYDGTIAGSFTTDLKPADPQYTMSLNVSGFDMQKAVESQFQSFKDTLIGKLSASMTGAGSSFNPEEIKRKLQLKGDFKVANATFKTIDVARVANSAIGDSLAKISSKVPALQGKKVNIPANKESRYEMVSSNFTVSGGVLDAPNFVAKAAPKSGVDIRGSTKMGIVDQSLDAKWELVDSQHVTGSDQVNVAIAGKTINNVLAKAEKDPVIFPITVGCKWSDPCPNYASSAEYLAGVAAGRITKAAGEEAKAKVQGAVQDAVKKAVGGGQNPFKKLFGN